MGSLHQLAGLARRLNREVGAPPLPALFFFTDPERTPNPAETARRLPRGAAVVYRHFGATNRTRVARQLADVCRARALVLLIAADPGLARRVGAAGVHWPEHSLPARRDLSIQLVTAAAHSVDGALRAAAFGADACVLAPVFPTRSGSGRAPLGLLRASRIARGSTIPVIALGGVNARTASRLMGRGFAGLAAVEALTRA